MAHNRPRVCHSQTVGVVNFFGKKETFLRSLQRLVQIALVYQDLRQVMKAGNPGIYSINKGKWAVSFLVIERDRRFKVGSSLGECPREFQAPSPVSSGPWRSGPGLQGRSAKSSIRSLKPTAL